MKAVVKAFFCFTIILSLFSGASGRIIYIPSPSLATIQGGINYALDGDTVLVNSGTYYENINFKGKKIVVASRYLLDNDTSQISSTIIDGQYPRNPDSASVVRFISNEDSSAILKGFTLRNGTGINIPGYSYGGGIYCYSSSPLISDNIIESNSSSIGAGIYCENSSSSIMGNRVFSNMSSSRAGGIDCVNSSAKIVNNIIQDNKSGSFGGGIELILGSNPVVRNNLIISNEGVYGGGIAVRTYNPIDIVNNTISGNKSPAGGGILCSKSSPNIINNIVVNSIEGTGIEASGESANPTIKYNDVWNNAGGNFSGTPLGVGNMFWGKNQKGIPCDQFFNISQEPKFVNPPIDFSLQCSSPCINDGDPSFPVPPSGGPRIDMGAFEYPLTTGDVDSNGKIDISDVVYLINYCYKGGPAPNPLLKGDVTADGLVNANDIIHLINYLFRNGMPPCH